MIELKTLEGGFEYERKKQRLFSTHSALTDYMRVFNIVNGAFGVHKQNGQVIYVLEYFSEE